MTSEERERALKHFGKKTFSQMARIAGVTSQTIANRVRKWLDGEISDEDVLTKDYLQDKKRNGTEIQAKLDAIPSPSPWELQNLT